MFLFRYSRHAAGVFLFMTYLLSMQCQSLPAVVIVHVTQQPQLKKPSSGIMPLLKRYSIISLCEAILFSLSCAESRAVCSPRGRTMA